MHSCVHTWTLHVLNKEWDGGMVDVAIECVASHVPDRNARDAWVTQQKLVQYAAKCWSFITRGIVNEDQGKLALAEQMYERALQGYEKALGPEPVKTYVPALNATENLANLYEQLGRVSEAKEVYSYVLHGLEIVFGRSSKRYQDVNSALEALNIDDEH